MKKFILFTTAFFFTANLHAQELFVFSEPASNMATKSIGLRANNFWMREQNTDRYRYMSAPEIMVGVSKKLMLHAEGFLSNIDNTRFKINGGAAYAKYRFYSQDEVHNHFRLAAFARGAINNMMVHYPAINLNGQNSGYEAGVVATKLINKIAIAAGSSFVHASNNLNGNKFLFANKNAVNYNLSFGKLMLPKEYTDYNQTNVNLMLELLGQMNTGSRKNFTDLAPSVQFIILSRMRVDLGYRFALVKDLPRMSNDGFLIRFEYNIFNAYK